MQDVFEFAMKMELDGKAFYEKMASKTKIPALKKILQGLAEDEQRHYVIFRNLKEHHSGDLSRLSQQTTSIISTAKNVFEELAAAGSEIDTKGDTIEVWRQAQDVEKKSEDFYRDKAKEVTDKAAKDMLNKIAAEEHKHWALIEAVMQFLNRPTTWLEDAEWGNLDEY